jgi:hypothetical protein
MADVDLVRDQTFPEIVAENPCIGCSAPCCRILLIPHPTPATLMDLDYIRYMLGFQGVQMILTREGQWRILVEQQCGLLDSASCRCTVHGTARKPKTCVYFNPYHCWYKRNFHNTKEAPDLIRINTQSLELLLQHVRFDEDCKITDTPPWELVRELLRGSETALADGKPVALIQIAPTVQSAESALSRAV